MLIVSRAIPCCARGGAIVCLEISVVMTATGPSRAWGWVSAPWCPSPGHHSPVVWLGCPSYTAVILNSFLVAIATRPRGDRCPIGLIGVIQARHAIVIS